jgi:hypothetical protein
MEPVLLAIASAAAGKASEAAFKGGASVVKKIAEAVRQRFSDEPEDAVVLLRAESGKESMEELAAAIERACAADPEFRRRLGELVGQPIQVAASKFHNEFHGDVKNVVQADTIHNLRLD